MFRLGVGGGGGNCEWFIVFAPASAPPGPRKLSLGVIFLTLYIDLIGFSIIFPLVPDILAHYLAAEGQSGLLGWLVAQADRIAAALNVEGNFTAVLLGGVLSSIYALLQFIFAPFWGAVSDRRGRRPVLIITVAGTALSYLLWALSGSFWLFFASRLLGGIFGGNISVATAAVADVTTRAERSRAMGLVGAAFGLGLVTGPVIGAFTAGLDLTAWGLNPFAAPALVALAMSIVNLVWIQARFKESLHAGQRDAETPVRLRNPLAAALGLSNPAVRRINVVAFIFALAFCAMEFSLTFLGADRFGFTARQNGLMLGFLGLCAILTQGIIVRRLLKTVEETKVLRAGLVFAAAGLLVVGFAPTPGWLYPGLALLALGSGLVNPATSGLISLYSGAHEQGRVLGIFRSLGSLARTVTPVLAGLAFWFLGGTFVFSAAAVLALGALAFAVKLPTAQR